MKAIKKINNNVALCIDGSGHQLVAFGKGIGFPAMPYEIQDMSLIERTYYDIDDVFLPVLQEVSYEVLEIARQISEQAQKTIGVDFNVNMPITLADHINFCIERYKKKIRIKLPAIQGIEVLYPKEVEIGRKAVELINKTLHISLPETEVAGIAMNIINAEIEPVSTAINYNEEQIIEEIINIIEESYDIQLDRMNYDYVRLDAHLRYLCSRMGNNSSIQLDYREIYEPLRKESPKTEACVNKIAEYIRMIWKTDVDTNERLYLWLHIDRIVKKNQIRNAE